MARNRKQTLEQTVAYMRERVVIDARDCHVWQGKTDRSGYVGIKVWGETTKAHRAMYTFTHGAIPAGLHVLHRCDNPSCINPDHLFLGTHADNMKDRHRKGRYDTQPKGEATYNCKLTDVQVGYVRSQRAEGCSLKSLAAFYGVSQSLISQVARGTHR